MKVIRVLSIIFIAWFVFSWADIVSDNNKPNPQHSDINMFELFFTNENN